MTAAGEGKGGGGGPVQTCCRRALDKVLPTGCQQHTHQAHAEVIGGRVEALHIFRAAMPKTQQEVQGLENRPANRRKNEFGWGWVVGFACCVTCDAEKEWQNSHACAVLLRTSKHPSYLSEGSFNSTHVLLEGKSFHMGFCASQQG